MFKEKRLTTSHFTRLLTILMVILVVDAIGTYWLVKSHAATPYASAVASTGTISNGAQMIQNCVGSTTGTCVAFDHSIPMDGNVALALSNPGTPFAPTSFWNTPLPTNTPVNPDTPEYINAIEYNLCYDATANPNTPPPACPGSTYYGYLNNTAYSSPLYVVPANQPTTTVLNNCSSTNSYFLASLKAVPIPADAHAAAGTDEHISIYQPSTNSYWEFWGFQKNAGGQWTACYGGLINNVSQSDGIFPDNTGGTATSIPLLGAVARIEELQAGHIDHVVGLAIGDDATANLCTKNNNQPTCPSPGYSWPATRTDGGNPNPLAIPEGTRFRLPANLNLSQYNLTPVALTIAVAAQKYGLVVDDSCGQPCVTIRTGDPTTYTTAGLLNPYTSGPGVDGVGTSGLYEGKSPGLIMQNFPWNQLQALPFNYGEPTP